MPQEIVPIIKIMQMPTIDAAAGPAGPALTASCTIDAAAGPAGPVQERPSLDATDALTASSIKELSTNIAFPRQKKTGGLCLSDYVSPVGRPTGATASSDNIAMFLVSVGKGVRQIAENLKNRGDANVIFFASWCASCKPHLEAKYDDATVFVAVFDEQKRAEKVLNALKIEGICFTSDEFARDLGVRSLPAARIIGF